MDGWHHRFNGCEFEQALGGGDRQRSLELGVLQSWGCKSN